MRPGPGTAAFVALVAWQDQVSEPHLWVGGGSASEDVGEVGEGEAALRKAGTSSLVSVSVEKSTLILIPSLTGFFI